MSNDEYWKARNQGQNGNARPVGGGPGAWQGYDQGKRERETQQQNSYIPSAPPPYIHTQNNNNFNNSRNIQSDNTGGFSPSYSSSGGGCITAFFPVISYIIVFSTLFNFIGALNTLSITYTYKIPEWLPSVVILTFTCVVLYYRKYIGRIAILSIIILIGNSYLLNDENYKTLVQKISAKPIISSPFTSKNKSNISKATVPKTTLLDQCRSCSKILTFRGKLPPSVKEGKKKYCEIFKRKCIKQGYKW